MKVTIEVKLDLEADDRQFRWTVTTTGDKTESGVERFRKDAAEIAAHHAYRELSGAGR